MKKSIIAGAAALVMLSAVPASAQNWNRPPPPAGAQGWDRDAFWRDAPNSAYERIDFLQQRINRSASDGSLDRREARQSQGELNDIRRMARDFRRGDRGGLSPRHADLIQQRLDTLSQRLRWQRVNGRNAWNNTPPPQQFDERRYATDYDASRDYRDGNQYRERELASNDQVYRGSDGRYYCKRNDGTTGLIIGGVGGGVLGNVIDGGHNRVAGTLIGGALGALAGKAIEQSNDKVKCR